MIEKFIVKHTTYILLGSAIVILAVALKIFGLYNTEGNAQLQNQNASISSSPVIKKDISVSDFKTLLLALKNEGLVSNLEAQAKGDLFTTEAKLVSVGGEFLQVYEFVEPLDADAEAKTVSKDGGTIGKTNLDTKMPTHFYKKGKIIVLYIGEDEELITVLEKLLGPQFAGI